MNQVQKKLQKWIEGALNIIKLIEMNFTFHSCQMGRNNHQISFFKLLTSRRFKNYFLEMFTFLKVRSCF